jgi:predicted small lipoprotein YifL
MMRAFPECRPLSKLSQSPSIASRSVRGLLICGVVLVALAGCGRRGPLEPPPGAVNPQPDMTNLEPDEPRPFLPSVRPVGTGKKGKPINAPKDSFILDPIL